MYRIVHYGDQPERTWVLLNSYRERSNQEFSAGLDAIGVRIPVVSVGELYTED